MLSFLALAQGLAQLRYIPGQIAFLDERVRPDGLDQFVFFQQMPVMFDQHQQQVEGFGRERNYFAIAQQQALGNVKPKAAEFVKVFWLKAYNSSLSSHRTFTEFFQSAHRTLPRG
jgi:hypothetical protein